MAPFDLDFQTGKWRLILKTNLEPSLELLIHRLDFSHLYVIRKKSHSVTSFDFYFRFKPENLPKTSSCYPMICNNILNLANITFTTDQLGLKGSYYPVKLFPITTMFIITTVEIVQHSYYTCNWNRINTLFNLLQVKYNVTGWDSTNIYYP